MPRLVAWNKASKMPRLVRRGPRRVAWNKASRMPRLVAWNKASKMPRLVRRVPRRVAWNKASKMSRVARGMQRLVGSRMSRSRMPRPVAWNKARRMPRRMPGLVAWNKARKNHDVRKTEAASRAGIPPGAEAWNKTSSRKDERGLPKVEGNQCHHWEKSAEKERALQESNWFPGQEVSPEKEVRGLEQGHLECSKKGWVAGGGRGARGGRKWRKLMRKTCEGTKPVAAKAPKRLEGEEAWKKACSLYMRGLK